MTSVLIVDDQPLIRDAVSRLLGQQEGMEVLGQAGDGVEALQLLERAVSEQAVPDIVLMDIRMPRLDGIQTTQAICEDPRYAGLHVLILTPFEDDEYVFAALRAGASGFIAKASETEEIVRALRAVIAGDALLSPAATKALIERYIVKPGAAGAAGAPGVTGVPGAAGVAGAGGMRGALADQEYRLDALTSREQEVLYLIGRGRSNTEIADDMVISPLTAKTHVNRILAKLNARDRAQLVIYAYESGLLND